MSQVRDALRDYIVREYLRGETSALPVDDENLIERDIIDSLGIFLLVSFLQDRFGIDVDPSEISFDNFATINAITHLVEAKVKP